jgi:hypothetical protein
MAPGRLGSADRTPRVLSPTTRLPAGVTDATRAIHGPWPLGVGGQNAKGSVTDHPASCRGDRRDQGQP